MKHQLHLIYCLAILISLPLGIFSQVTEDDIANKINPIDYVGQKHNHYVKIIFENIGSIKSREGLAALTYELVTSDVKGASKEQLDYFREQATLCSKEGGCFPTKPFSRKGQEFYSSLLDVFDLYQGEHESDLLSTIVKFKNIETKISSSNLEEREKNILFASASIGRYSSHYWFYNTENWVQYAENSGHPLDRPFSWGDVAQADMQSGCTAGTVGALAGGSVSFGTLTVPGWVVGALGGAVGGSVGNALYQLF